MTMGFIIIGVIGIGIFVAWLAIEQHDKTSREKQGLPPRRYHDITDQEIETVYVHEFKK